MSELFGEETDSAYLTEIENFQTLDEKKADAILLFSEC